MVEVGQLEITGTMNDTDINQGFDRIIDDFKNAENQANQANASMGRLSNTASMLGKGLITIGTVGVGALTALASKSPVLAGTFAKMEVNMLKLSNTVGRQLKPAFEGVNQFIQDLNTSLSDNGTIVSTVAGSIGESFQDVGSIITGQWNNIQNIIPKGTGVALGIRLGSKFGLTGMLAGAALGLVMGDVAGDILTPDVTAQEQAQFGTFAETAGAIREAREPLGNVAGNRGGEMGTQVFQLAGRGGKIAYNFIIDLVQSLIEQTDTKNMRMTTSSGTSGSW